MLPMRVRVASDLRVGDTVFGPSKRAAVVVGFPEGRVELRYIDDGDETLVQAHHLTLIAQAKPRAFPKTFFREPKVAAP